MLLIKKQQIVLLDRHSLEAFSTRLAKHLSSRQEFATFFGRSDADALVYQFVWSAYRSGFATQLDIARYVNLSLICHRDVGQTQAMNELRAVRGMGPSEALDQLESATDSAIKED